MRPDDIPLSQIIEEKLIEFDATVRSLPGINNYHNRECFVSQIIDSIRRIRYVTVIRDKAVGEVYKDASNVFFDPLKAASWYKRNGDVDEACWLIFLSIHFGKNRKSGWGLTRGVYGKMENQNFWTWETTSNNFEGFRQWLGQNRDALKLWGSFGNHRKYQSLSAFSSTGTGSTIGSYIEWVGPEKSHLLKAERLIAEVGDDPKVLFDALYKSMDNVIGFGRTARFDFLTMIGKFGLMNVIPPSTYMHGATGPKSGAKLLFGAAINANITDSRLTEFLTELDSYLNLYFGMQVLEDSLCNWQKSPSAYVNFSG